MASLGTSPNVPLSGRATTRRRYPTADASSSPRVAWPGSRCARRPAPPAVRPRPAPTLVTTSTPSRSNARHLGQIDLDPLQIAGQQLAVRQQRSVPGQHRVAGPPPRARPNARPSPPAAAATACTATAARTRTMSSGRSSTAVALGSRRDRSPCPSVRMNSGSSRASAGMSRYSSRPISSPWNRYSAPGSAAVSVIAARGPAATELEIDRRIDVEQVVAGPRRRIVGVEPAEAGDDALRVVVVEGPRRCPARRTRACRASRRWRRASAWPAR